MSAHRRSGGSARSQQRAKSQSQSAKEQKRKAGSQQGSPASSSSAHSAALSGDESPAGSPRGSPSGLSLAAIQEACGSADLYLLLQLLGADSDENLQRAWFWNATRFVDAGVDDPAELGSLLATRITEDLLAAIYNKDTATLGFELEPTCLKRFRRSGIDINQALEIEPIQFRPPGADLSPNRAAAVPPGETGTPTALHLASEVGHAGITNLLLQLRADPHIVDPVGQTPMCVAARQNFNLVVDEILRSEQLQLTPPKPGDAASQERFRRTQQTVGRALIVAAIEGNSKIVQQLLDAGVDVNSCDQDGVSIVQHAASTGQLLVVQRAIAKGASLDNDALCRACATGSLATVMYLRDAGMAVDRADASGHTPLMLAAARGNLEIVEYLCLQGADVNHRGGKDNLSPIMLAARAGHTPVVIYLSREWEAEDRREALTTLPQAMHKRRMREELEAAQIARQQAAQHMREAQRALNDSGSEDDDDEEEQDEADQLMYSLGPGDFDDEGDEGDEAFEGDEGDEGDESFSEGDLEQLMSLADDPELRKIMERFESQGGLGGIGGEEFEVIDVDSDSSSEDSGDHQEVPAPATRSSPRSRGNRSEAERARLGAQREQNRAASAPSRPKPSPAAGGRKRKQPENEVSAPHQKRSSSPRAAASAPDAGSPRKRSKSSPQSSPASAAASPASRRR